MSEPFMAEIRSFAFSFPPRNWTHCYGQLASISEYSAIYALVGTIYGGDGRTTFGVPDLRGRMPMGMGLGPGLTARTIGTMWGREYTALTTRQLASHDHEATFTPSGGSPTNVETTIEVSTTQASDQTAKAGDYLAAGTASGRPEAAIYVDQSEKGNTVSLGGVTSTATGGGSSGTVTVHQNGSGQPFQIMNPFLTINYCMALAGLFPPRN